jgi:DNA replication protein DnaC
MACAFGMEACKQFYTVKYIRLPELLAELAIARGEGPYKKTIAQ